MSVGKLDPGFQKSELNVYSEGNDEKLLNNLQHMRNQPLLNAVLH